VLADGSLASYFRGRVESFYLGESHPRAVEIPQRAWDPTCRRGPTLDDGGPDGEAHWAADGCASRNANGAGLRSHHLPGGPSRGRARPSGPTSGAGPTAARPSLRAPAPHRRPVPLSVRESRLWVLTATSRCSPASLSEAPFESSAHSPPTPHTLIHGRTRDAAKSRKGPAGGRRGTSMTAWSPASRRPSHSAPNVVLELHLPQPQGQRKFLPAGFHRPLPATAERLGRDDKRSETADPRGL
jgi:hypothetical protein